MKSIGEAWARLVAWLRRPSPLWLAPSDQPIEAAAKDAEMLLAFAAQSRRSLKREIVEQLTAAQERVSEASGAGGRPLTASEKAAFWHAYDELAVAMAPLSAHSIRTSMMVNGKSLPGSLFTHTAVLAFVATAVFVTCLLIQAFWVAGKELLDKADAIDTQRIELTKAAHRSEMTFKRLAARAERLNARLCAAGGACPTDGLEVAAKNKKKPTEEVSRLLAQRDTIDEELSERQLAADEQGKDLEDANERGKPVQALLGEWYQRMEILCGPDRTFKVLCPVDVGALQGKLDKLQIELRPLNDKLAGLESELRLIRPLRPPFGVTMQVSPQRQLEYAEKSKAAADLRRQVVPLRQEAAQLESMLQRRSAHEVRISLSNLATYVLPLLMGFLGALTYLLQTMTTQLRDHTFVPVAVSGTIVRLCLGGIAGVFGGLVGTSGDPALKSLPPLFVPFVFGYGIEILFALLNKVVRTFTQSDATPARP